MTVGKIDVSAGVLLSLGDPEAPVVLVKGQLDFSYPCVDFIVVSVVLQLKFTTVIKIPDIPGSLKIACPAKVAMPDFTGPVFDIHIGGLPGPGPIPWPEDWVGPGGAVRTQRG